MKYATWNLNFTNPEYGTGPETTIAQQGYSAEPSWTNGIVENGATILGYISGEPTAEALQDWNFTYITQEEALSFCQAINANAYLLPDGRITAPIEDLYA